MKEEEIFEEKTFIELFSMNDLKRIERENFLYIQAKKFGLEKTFKDTLKKYEKIFKEKISLEENLKLPKSKYKIENFNTGGYSCTTNGITDNTGFKFSYIPMLPVERYYNKETNKEKIKIIYFRDNEWRELILDINQIAISQKMILLSDYGLGINSENVKYFIKYFGTIMSLNEIPILDSVSHIGWQMNYFIPYDSQGIFDGGEEFKNIYQAISSKGNYNKWKETIKELRKHKVIKILMAVTLASPLLEKLSIQPYIVNLWSSLSGNGKTLSCMVAMSIWGNPNVGALRLSSNNTQNYYITIASFMRNITCYFDELQIVQDNKYLNMESLVMDLCNGTEKGRLGKNSQIKEVKTWFNNFLFTSNNQIVEENSGEQLYNRVIDLEIREKIIENGSQIANIIKNNYGFAGKEYIKYIQSVGFDKILERFNKIYNQILNETSATSKQANSLASILLSNELANECIFDDDYILQIEDIKEYVNDKEEIKTSYKARDYIISIINANIKRFDDNNYGECWGIRTNDFIITINAEILQRELKKGGFKFNTVKKEWADMGFLEKNSQNRYVYQTTVRKEKGNYVRLKI